MTPPEPTKINIGRARYRLLGGPYKAPSVKRGQIVRDAIRGAVEVIGFTPAKIRWPVGKCGRSNSPVVFAGLLDALRHESGMAIQHHWGASEDQVWKWRRLLGVKRGTPGDVALRNAYYQHPKRKELNRTPEHRAKISAAKRGVPKPPGVMARLHRSHVGRKRSAATRKKMRDAWKRRRERNSR